MTTVADGVSTGTFWITLALIDARLAQSKRRSRLAWFLLSLLLGPIATFLVVITGYGDRAPEADERAAAPSTR